MFSRRRTVLFTTATIAIAFFAPQCNAQGLQACRGNLSRFARSWNEFSDILVLKRPTEVQNLVDLRLRINNLRATKQMLIGRIRTIADLGDTPGWLETRLGLGALYDEIDSALKLIDQTARQAGWLAGSEFLGPLLDTLRSRKGETICELTRIPFPLSTSDKQRLATLLQILEEENAALGKFDQQLGELIRKASNR